MRIPLYQVDAFADRVFGGNPAAVCPLESWLPDATMQAIASENNLSETAFFVREGDGYGLRWFTPTVEIDLAGHPTLATAHVIFTELAPERHDVRFRTKIGDTLIVTRDGPVLWMDFPARPPKKRDAFGDVAAALGATPLEVLAARDGFAVFARQADLRALKPDMARIAALDCFGLIATAPGDGCDFVSRYFAPGAGVPEDPVTGSAHCTLIPYWAKRLGKTALEARQISTRGGTLHCEDRGHRVGIGGRAVTYLTGTIAL
ncbi:MAG: PhzF family phenazine biosynthesis protein [Candidatus Eiseniibacteriota bacterium]